MGLDDHGAAHGQAVEEEGERAQLTDACEGREWAGDGLLRRRFGAGKQNRMDEATSIPSSEDVCRIASEIIFCAPSLPTLPGIKSHTDP